MNCTDRDIQILLARAGDAIDAAHVRHLAAGGNEWDGPAHELNAAIGKTMRRYSDLPQWDDNNLATTESRLRELATAAATA